MEEATKSSTPPELAKLLPEPSSSGSEENTQATATSTQPSQVSANVTSSASASTQGSETGSATSKEPRGEDTEEGGDLLSNLSHYFYQKLGFDTDEEAVHVLEEPTLDGIVRYIHGGKCKNVIAMIGAGISTAAGIPDFRSPTSGIYSKLGKYNLPSPEAIFEIGYFRRNPAPFYSLARQLFPQDLKPTLSHYFLRLLHEKGLLLRLYTQNIDGLERVAGVPIEKIVEAHGTFHTSHCINPKCNRIFTLSWLRDKIATDTVPFCPVCSSIIKPDIVFFGERLPERFFELSEEDFARCDLLIIIGTSLQVQPFAGLVDKVHNSIPRLLINLEKCGQGNLMSKILGLGCGLDFDSEANYRDVALLGTCDSGCRLVVDRLGWKDDLSRLVEREEAARIALVEATAAARFAAEEATATAAATAAVKQQLQKQQQQKHEEESEKKAVAAPSKP
uniref:Putative sirtuin 5 n=1 Tax=Ixodes ricinus TaxID=34613 RepID=A0A6B0VB07_IXORI